MGSGYPPRIGLTGSIGSGKSSVADRLAARGALVLDADAFARAATEDPEVLARIAEDLGPHLVVDGALDRSATAALVFGDAEARRALEAIIHPWVRRAAVAAEAAAVGSEPPPPLVVHEVPLLFETGLDRDMDATVAVVAPLEVRVARLQARSGLDAEAVRARDAAQMPQAEKARRASFVIDNAGSEADLDAAVADLWPRLLSWASEGAGRRRHAASASVSENGT